MKLNLLTVVGLTLLALGVLALLGFTIPGTETFSAGPLSATVETERQVSPAIGGLLVALGMGGLFLGQKKS